MNNEIPSLWLWISGIFFLLGIGVLGVSVFVMLKVLKIAEEMKPKIDSVVTKVEALTVKIDALADKADTTLTSVKQSVDGVGGRANGIMGALETITLTVATKIEGLAPIVAGAMAAYRLFTSVKSHRAQPKPETATKELPAKKKR